MTTLVGQASRAALGVLAVTLVVIGGGTGLALQIQAERALDRTLLAAAFGFAHDDADREPLANDHVPRPVDVRVWTPGDPHLTEEEALDVVRGDHALWRDVGDERVLAILVEPESALGRPDDDGHPHHLLIASAPRIRAASVWGPFLVAYGAVSLLVFAFAAWLLHVSVRRALRPLDRAVRTLGAVRTLDSGTRLDTSGPVEVAAVLEATNDLLSRLETAYRAQASFTARAAHELRTPLTILQGELDLVLRRPRDPDQLRAALEKAAEQTRRLSELVDALMALARVDGGEAERGRTVERASHVVTEALARDGRPLAGRIRVDLQDDPEVSMHVPLVTAAIGNLLRNAARHAPESQVTITVASTDGLVSITVDDDGPGLPPEARRAALEPFVHRNAGGLGLGLPLTREIARRHGGDLTLGEAPGGGLRATVTLAASRF